MQSRAERAESNGGLEFPPLTLPYLLPYFYDVGPAKSSGMGLVAVDYQDLIAWCSFSGFMLSSWEAETLRKMSKVYVNQASVSAEVNCPCPWMAEQPPKDKIAHAMQSALRSLSK